MARARARAAALRARLPDARAVLTEKYGAQRKAKDQTRTWDLFEDSSVRWPRGAGLLARGKS